MALSRLGNPDEFSKWSKVQPSGERMAFLYQIDFFMNTPLGPLFPLCLPD